MRLMLVSIINGEIIMVFLLLEVLLQVVVKLMLGLIDLEIIIQALHLYAEAPCSLGIVLEIKISDDEKLELMRLCNDLVLVAFIYYRNLAIIDKSTCITDSKK